MTEVVLIRCIGCGTPLGNKVPSAGAIAHAASCPDHPLAAALAAEKAAREEAERQRDEARKREEEALGAIVASGEAEAQASEAAEFDRAIAIEVAKDAEADRDEARREAERLRSALREIASDVPPVSGVTGLRALARSALEGNDEGTSRESGLRARIEALAIAMENRAESMKIRRWPEAQAADEAERDMLNACAADLRSLLASVPAGGTATTGEGE